LSQAASQAAAFYREVALERRVWSLRDSGGIPAPRGDGGRSMPFWSSRRRVETIIKNVAAYHGFEPFEIPLADFLQRWLPGLERDGLKVGVNWNGTRAIGYDVEPKNVELAIKHAQGADL
jgi:hypothetical protein